MGLNRAVLLEASLGTLGKRYIPGSAHVAVACGYWSRSPEFRHAQIAPARERRASRAARGELLNAHGARASVAKRTKRLFLFGRFPEYNLVLYLILFYFTSS